MKNKKLLIRFDNVLLLLHFLLLLIICIPFSSSSIYNQFAYILPYCNLIYILLAGIRMWRDKNFNSVMLLVITTILIAAICFINGSSMGSASAYLTLIFGMYYACKIEYNDTFLELVSLTGEIYIALSTLIAHNYFIKWSSNSNLINPNVLSAITLIFLMIINIKWTSTRRGKYLIVLFNLLAIYEVWSYDSRTCLFALIVYYLFSLFISKGFRFGQKSAVVITILIIVGGMLFPLFYINTPQWLIGIISNITHKTFYSGRQVIWKRFFDTIANDKLALFIGPGSHMESYFGEVNLGSNRIAYLSMHNSYLGIMLNFGLLGMILYCFFLAINLRDIFKNNNDLLTSKCLISYIVFLIVSYAEMNLLNSYEVMAFNILLGISKNYISDVRDIMGNGQVL